MLLFMRQKTENIQEFLGIDLLHFILLIDIKIQKCNYFCGKKTENIQEFLGIDLLHFIILIDIKIQKCNYLCGKKTKNILNSELRVKSGFVL
jgi:hypothetical protein